MQIQGFGHFAAILVSACFGVLLLWPEAAAEETELPAGHAPQVCIGFHPEREDWGWNWLRGPTPHRCAADTVLMEVDDPGGPSGPGEFISVHGNCCPLPAKDILLQETVMADSHCPDSFVVTGKENALGEGNRPIVQLRCTKVNTNRYLLGPAKPGLYWGEASGWTFLNETRRMRRSQIPLGMRHAVGRIGKTNWEVDGCVGDPPGSLLVAKESKRCSGFYFRQLLYRGLPGDPPTGTPVTMFPECIVIEQILSPEPVCIAPPRQKK